MIIGGGPAGAAAAIAIARAGRQVTLIEREAEAAHKVCGDFISAEAIATLVSLGIDLSAASCIDTVRLVHRDRIATARLPFLARGMSRRALDEALLRQARSSGASLLRGRRIHTIERDAAGYRLDRGAAAPVVADTVFLATGKHELRGAGRPRSATRMVGCKMYLALAPSQRETLRRHVELVLLPGGYAGLQMVEADRAVICALLPSASLPVGNRWEDLLACLMDRSAHLRTRLAGARALLPRPLTIAGLPYGHLLRPDPRDPPALYRLGDQAAVIASLTGDGVAVALASGTLAARTWLAGGSAPQYHQRLAAGMSRQMMLASTLHRLCLSPAMQSWVVAVCTLWPGAIRLAAAVTRHTFDG